MTKTSGGTWKRDIDGHLHTSKHGTVWSRSQSKLTGIINKYIEGVRNDKDYKNSTVWVQKEIDWVLAKIVILAAAETARASNTIRGVSIDKRVDIIAARRHFDKISKLLTPF